MELLRYHAPVEFVHLYLRYKIDYKNLWAFLCYFIKTFISFATTTKKALVFKKQNKY